MQSLIVQSGSAGPIRLQQRTAEQRIVPGGHRIGIEKLDWLPTEVTDHYALCVLRSDYHWDDEVERICGG